MSKIPKALSPGEEQLALHLRAHGIEFEREVCFHPKRRWRVDFFVPAANALIEVEGGSWVGGRHVTGSGFSSDCEKYNRATIMGFRVLRYSTEMVAIGQAINDILEIMP